MMNELQRKSDQGDFDQDNALQQLPNNFNKLLHDVTSDYASYVSVDMENEVVSNVYESRRYV